MERIEGLKPQLDRLKQNITTTKVDEDPEETRRRAKLARYVRRLLVPPALVDGPCSVFDEIEKESQELLAKGAAAQFIDKGADSGKVARLIERLREAIGNYQVSGSYLLPRVRLTGGQISQQQGIYNRITDLTVGILHLSSARHTDVRFSFLVVFRCALETPRSNYS
jgi:hypothetical protein